ncbi:MAG: ClpXP protease specificity-enhancing factor [Burkholderiaceae bacterium]|jgi:stringent starvation protein B|nr:ClpXP protease specificity-enhancing factor [Burkholderiaceae bacterium]
MTAPEATSTRPYLIRALYEWCTDNGFTPHIAVRVDRGVQVPREFVRDGEIVLNISYDATSGLQMGNDFISFTARFGGQPREIMVPVDKVMAIYARETGQGMAFPPVEEESDEAVESPSEPQAEDTQEAHAGDERVVQLVSTPAEPADDEPPRTPPPSGSRPSLKLVK